MPLRYAPSFFSSLLLLTAVATAQPTPSVRLILQSPGAGGGFGFGHAVAGAQDFDGDGIPDVVVGSTNEDVGGMDDAGRAYVFSGMNGGLLLTLTSPDPQTTGLFGRAVAAGDLSGDGVPDVVVNAMREDVGGVLDAGRVYAFSGRDGSLLYTIEAPEPEARGYFGLPTAIVDDLNGDGVPDLLIGEGGWRGGSVYAFSGATGTLQYTIESPSAEPESGFGFQAVGTGDLDGDGVVDLLISAPYEDVDGVRNVGRVYVFSGIDGGLIGDMTTPSPAFNTHFGYAIADVGDVQGDGVPDILIGAPFYNFDEYGDGRAYLYSGSDLSLIRTFVHPEGDTENRYFGSSVVGLEDVDGDLVPDVAIDAPQDSVSVGMEGNVLVFSGATGALLWELTLPYGSGILQGTGVHLAAAGEVQGGGAANRGLLIGAPAFDGGRVYLVTFAVPVSVESPPPSEQGVMVAPNPATERSRIRFVLTAASDARLTVYDLLGREVVRILEGPLPAGTHEIPVDVKGWSPGTYVFHLQLGDDILTGRLTTLR